MNNNNKDLVKLGSDTAKGGFRNENDVVVKFNNWKKDEDAQKWLEIMGYPPNEIEKVEAIKITGSYKTDVQVQVTIYLKKVVAAENLSIKLISNPRGFNQVDKRWVDKYVELWDIPSDVASILKKFTGEVSHNDRSNARDSRRVFLDEMDSESQRKIVEFFSTNKMLVVSDIIKGRGKLSAGWMLVAFKSENGSKWVLKSINHAMNVFGKGDIEISSKGSLKIGRITMQRKGGDAGRPTANMLQFKINPAELFEESLTANQKGV